MTPEARADGIETWTNGIHAGDAAETLREMPESSVHMAMCSPPYYGLRDYGVDGQIGLEDSLDEYIQELVDVGRALRRVLRDDGSWWLNLGDSYSTERGNHHSGEDVGGAPDADYHSGEREGGFGRKNKMLVPHRVAIALQEDGWVVRNDVTWYKPNPMPSSVKDRLNTCTEQVFHLTPEPDYWYDLDAIREAHKPDSTRLSKTGDHKYSNDGPGDHSMKPEQRAHPAGKNPGDVFEVTTKPYPDAHFAVYPPELCEKPIKATCPPKVCADCGAPYKREVEVERENYANRADRIEATGGAIGGGVGKNFPDTEREFKGWTPTCDCDTDETRAGIALDPFAGAGTTCMVAKRLGRRFVGIDLNPEYVAMAEKRVGVTVTNPSYLTDERQKNLRELAATDGGKP
jgi:DNA modification methylase